MIFLRFRCWDWNIEIFQRFLKVHLLCHHHLLLIDFIFILIVSISFDRSIFCQLVFFSKRILLHFPNSPFTKYSFYDFLSIKIFSKAYKPNQRYSHPLSFKSKRRPPVLVFWFDDVDDRSYIIFPLLNSIPTSKAWVSKLSKCTSPLSLRFKEQKHLTPNQCFKKRFLT